VSDQADGKTLTPLRFEESESLGIVVEVNRICLSKSVSCLVTALVCRHSRSPASLRGLFFSISVHGK
jgi:hypothetical protein